MAIHGYPRYTKGIAFLALKRDLPRIRATVRPLGYTLPAGPIPFGVRGPHPHELYRLSKIIGTEVFTLDFLLVCPIFRAVWRGRRDYLWQGHRLHVVSVAGLARMKRSSARDQDRLDLKNLGVPHARKRKASRPTG